MPLGSSLPARIVESPGAIKYAAPGGNDSTGDGSIGNPWATVSKLMATLTAGQVGQLRAGTYGSGLTAGVTWSAAGDVSNPITIENFPGEIVTIAQRIFVTGQYLRLRGRVTPGQLARHLILTTNNFGGVGSTNIWVGHDAAHIEIFGTEILNSVNQGCLVGKSSDSGAVPDDIQVISNYLHDNGTSSGSPGDHNLYYGTGGTVNGAIYNNIIYRSLVRQIQLYDGCDSAIVNNNTIVDGGRTQASVPDGIRYGGETVIKTINTLSVNNILYNNFAHGISTVWGSTPGTGNVARNNVGFTNDISDFDNANGGLTLSANIVADPLFANYAGADFRLLAGSPAISAGDLAYTPTFDFAGNPRINADIGAFVFIEDSSSRRMPLFSGRRP
jgi:hypothetical protein